MTPSSRGEWGEGNAGYGLRECRVLRATNLVSNGIDYPTAAQRFVPEAKVRQKRLRRGDLILEAAGGGPSVPVGRVARFTPPDEEWVYLVSNFFRTLRPAPNVDPRFVHHILHDLYQQPRIWWVQQQTTGIINLNVRDYLQLRVPVPPLEEQQRIAEILDTIDETIQATERVIAKLKAVLVALDRAIFVSTEADRLTRLGDECHVLGGKRLPAGHSYSTQRTEFRYLRVVDFYKRSVNYEGLVSLSESTFEALGRYEIRGGELFVSIAGSIGHVGVNWPPQGMRTILTENAARIIPSDSFVPSYLAIQMNSPAVADQVSASIGTGGGVPKLALHRLANIRVRCPDFDTQDQIVRWRESVTGVRNLEIRRLDKLRLIRAGLAADLLSGRVRTVAA